MDARRCQISHSTRAKGGQVCRTPGNTATYGVFLAGGMLPVEQDQEPVGGGEISSCSNHASELRNFRQAAETGGAFATKMRRNSHYDFNSASKPAAENAKPPLQQVKGAVLLSLNETRHAGTDTLQEENADARSVAQRIQS